MSGRGYTAREIYIGYPTWNDVNAAAAALGPAGGADFGNQEAVATAVIRDLNQRGGVAGRKVVPVFYDYKTGQDITAFNQAACAHWTQDRPVYAVVDNLGKSLDTELLPACLAKRHTYYVATGAAPVPQRLLTKYQPYFYLSAGPTWERFLPPMVQRAAAHDYFSGWNTTLGAAGSAPVKVGILSSNVYFAQDWAGAVAKELARSGHPAAVTFQLDGNATNQNSAAILRFRSEGVTHVVPFGGTMLSFPVEAEAQGYRPRYLLGTGLLSLIQKLAPPAQLHGALGVGYLPPSDVDNAHDPRPISAAQTQCVNLMHQAGQSTKSREALYMMMLGCDGFAFLKAATDLGARAGKGLSPDSLRRGLPLIKRLPSAAVFGGLNYPAGRPDGATSVRDLGFDDQGRSFTYLDRMNRPM